MDPATIAGAVAIAGFAALAFANVRAARFSAPVVTAMTARIVSLEADSQANIRVLHERDKRIEELANRPDLVQISELMTKTLAEVQALSLNVAQTNGRTAEALERVVGSLDQLLARANNGNVQAASPRGGVQT